MTFRNATTGWVGGDYPNNGFVLPLQDLRQRRDLVTAPCPCPLGIRIAYITTTAPKFFGTNDAILPVWMTLGAGMRDLFLYTTHDGGNTWTPSPAFARNAEQTDIISMNHAISWDWANVFHVTNNAGNTWTTVTPNVNFGEDFRGLDFVSATTGWVRQQTPDGLTVLYRTLDGGYTWTLISGNQPVPPTATPAPPPSTPAPDPAAFAQSIVNVLNTRNFNALPAMMDQSLGFAYWQSQGTSYPSDQAIESLRTGLHYHVDTRPGKDLNSLLDGMNPVLDHGTRSV